MDYENVIGEKNKTNILPKLMIIKWDKTIEKMRVVIKAAKAPAQPSGQDMKVAAEAQQTLNEAQMEKAKKQQEEMKANENPQKTEDSETEVQSEDIRTETPETKPQASLSEA